MSAAQGCAFSHDTISTRREECAIHHLSPQPAVAVFCAVEEEYRGILRSFPHASPLGGPFGERASVALGNRSRLLLLCPGVGAKRARECAVRVLEREGPVGLVISSGIAGILAPGRQIGDIVLSHRVWSYRAGQIRPLESAAAPPQPIWDTLTELGKEIQTKDHGEIWNGSLLSSDVPIADAALAAQLYRETGALCVEMEASGLLSVCREERIPFLCVKILSDYADQRAFFSMLRHQKRLCGYLGTMLAEAWRRTEFLC